MSKRGVWLESALGRALRLAAQEVLLDPDRDQFQPADFSGGRGPSDSDSEDDEGDEVLQVQQQQQTRRPSSRASRSATAAAGAARDAGPGAPLSLGDGGRVDMDPAAVEVRGAGDAVRRRPDVRREAVAMLLRQFDLSCHAALSQGDDETGVEQDPEPEAELRGDISSSKMLNNSWQIRVDNAVMTVPRSVGGAQVGVEVIRARHLEVFAEDSAKFMAQQQASLDRQTDALQRTDTIAQLRQEVSADETAAAQRSARQTPKRGHKRGQRGSRTAASRKRHRS
jgi:hypothetical protein